ncbi:uncharacterized protein CLUP02_14980 [Colletotrichum lupini]|uniref:Uncharacterized protein n=1 Tax=Colletotrichum lupini TaxID=145971 RepID=A0A9Q8T570_9PEZI|nr:uncharacterized protein CLUP02_14980 [Colletotrichum lupini]UQC89449.1 hypothetical protein CLUP02_14980 [Colletotrichum lupini]
MLSNCESGKTQFSSTHTASSVAAYSSLNKLSLPNSLYGNGTSLGLAETFASVIVPGRLSIDQISQMTSGKVALCTSTFSELISPFTEAEEKMVWQRRKLEMNISLLNQSAEEYCPCLQIRKGFSTYGCDGILIAVFETGYAEQGTFSR